MRGALKKEFTQEQMGEIQELRFEGYSYDNIAFMMHVGKPRVKDYCINSLGDTVVVRKAHVPEIEPCSVSIPRFSNPACKGHNPTLWFAVLARNANAKERQQVKINSQKAISICSSCENQLECLDYAVKAEPFGIWGGSNEAERMYIRKILKITCAREGGSGQNMRGITRPMMNSLTQNASNVAHLFTNPIVVNYIKSTKK